MAAPIQIYKKTICCSICGFQKKKISKGQEFCENCQPDRCEQLMLIKDYSLWLQENLMNEMNENRKKLRRNRERLFTDDEIDFILEYIDKEEKSTFEFILENEKARFKRDFNRQIKELQCKVESFFLEKRATLKIFQDDEQTENANYKKDISLLNNSKWIIEKKLSIILRHITYQPRQYALGNLSITGKSVQFVGLQQKDMKNCKAVRGLCVFNEKIFMIKWSNFNPTVSIVSVYDLKGNFIQNLSKTSNEFTAIDVTNDGKFYIADMTNNCVLESVDCTDFKPLFNIDHPQGISIGSDGIFIACDDPQTSRKHLINMYKFSFDGQLLYHFEDSYKSLFKVCVSGNNIISTHDIDNEITILDTVTGRKINLLLDKGYTPIGVCSLPNESFAIANYNKKSLSIYDKSTSEVCQISLNEKPVHLAFYENVNHYFLICHLLE